MKEHKVTKDTKSLVGETPKKWYQKYRLTPKQKKIWLGILGVFGVVLILGSVYSLGYSSGKKNAAQSSKASLFEDIEAPFDRIATGQVTSISKDKITIEVKGKDKTYQINAQTKVTEGKDQKQLSNVKKGMRVTVIRSSDKNNWVASRILIRAN